jgi:hypothetical protein
MTTPTSPTLSNSVERRGFLVDVFNDAAEMRDKVEPDAYRVAIFDFGC